MCKRQQLKNQKTRSIDAVLLFPGDEIYLQNKFFLIEEVKDYYGTKLIEIKLGDGFFQVFTKDKKVLIKCVKDKT